MKTFFILRHGESKWNEAQSKINISGMLDRDHALTEEGIEFVIVLVIIFQFYSFLGLKQAAELNLRWRHYASNSFHDGLIDNTSSNEIICFQSEGTIKFLLT
jgi:hypothetical protein